MSNGYVVVPVLLAALVAAIPGRARAADVDDPTRRSFVTAMTAVETLTSAPVVVDPPALRDYVLYPYLHAARLRRELALATPAANPTGDAPLPIDDAIAGFLRAHGVEPVTERLREAWLVNLAQRRSWRTYLDALDMRRDASVVLRCHALTARIALDRTDGLVEELKPVWLAPRSLPDECDPAIAWWQGRGGPGDDLADQRARLALRSGEPTLARHLARSLSPSRAASVLQWASLIEQPAAGIRHLLAEPGRAVEPEALRDGWERFARSDPEAAVAVFPLLVARRRLDEEAASPLALAVALALSWSRHPGALAFYSRVNVEDFDDRAHEWHVRAAVLAGDWSRAAAAIAAMPDALRTQSRWKYWAARSSERLGEFERARAGYAAVIPTDNWYALLAAARLDQRFVPNLQPLGIGDAAVKALSTLGGFSRAHELLRLGLDPEATAEWRAAFDAIPETRQREAVALATRWKWHDQAIATAARLRLFNDYELLYPRPYDVEVHAASRRTGLDEALIYAIIRQESLYRADAGSSAGALGLMQLLPGTARIVARRTGRPVPTRSQLLEPTVNVRLGASYLADLLDRFDGELALAAAGYNAGPNAARRWLPDAPLELDVWVENIPFNETRTYVQRVAWHTVVFDWLSTRGPRNVSDLLRSIKPVD